MNAYNYCKLLKQEYAKGGRKKANIQRMARKLGLNGFSRAMMIASVHCNNGRIYSADVDVNLICSAKAEGWIEVLQKRVGGGAATTYKLTNKSASIILKLNELGRKMTERAEQNNVKIPEIERKHATKQYKTLYSTLVYKVVSRYIKTL